MSTSSFGSYQREVFAEGLRGNLPALPADLDSVEFLAQERLGAGPFAYVHGPAGLGSTMRANREAFERWRIVPRMLTRSTVRRLETTVLGTDLPAPVMVAPVGVQSILHPDGELATAQASAELGLPMILSTMSSYSIEEVARANQTGPRWFQLYWPNDDDITLSLLSRARAAGFSTLVVTLDTMSLGWRPEIVSLSYLPMLRGIGTAVLFSDPVFRATLRKPPEEDLETAVAEWDRLFGVAGRHWSELDFLRRNWDGPILLKGIQHVEDARRAVAHGMDGIVVSNHGGRQVDGAVAALDTLPEIVAAVGDKLTVLFDSGVRTGADVFKALALGAQAVLIGRPYAYGLGLAGSAGVRHVLRSLLADLDMTLGLAGYRYLSELNPDVLTRPDWRDRTCRCRTQP